MPAKDLFHYKVVAALKKDGWTITADPYPLKLGEADLFVDLGAEKVFAAEKDGRKIAVEIKSFIGKSIIANVQDALGQFIMYQEVLQDKEPDRTLFLAVEEEIFENIFSEAIKNLLLNRLKFKMIIFNKDREEIVQWLT